MAVHCQLSIFDSALANPLLSPPSAKRLSPYCFHILTFLPLNFSSSSILLLSSYFFLVHIFVLIVRTVCHWWVVLICPSFVVFVNMAPPNNPSGGSRKISFNVSDQYDIQDVIGEGAYGVVW